MNNSTNSPNTAEGISGVPPAYGGGTPPSGVEICEELLGRFPQPYEHVVAEHNGRFAKFELDEAIAIIEGRWMPDFIHRYSAWWVAQMLRRGFIQKIYLMKEPEPFGAFMRGEPAWAFSFGYVHGMKA